MNLTQTIRESRPLLRESSLMVYENQINKLFRTVSRASTMRNLKFLNNYSKVEKFLEKYKDTSKKGYLNAIIVAIKSTKHLGAPLERYEKLRDSLGKLYDEEQSNNIKNDKQEKWIPWTQFVEGTSKLEGELIDMKQSKNLKDRIKYGDYILLRLYQQLPVRNDFHNMEIIHSDNIDSASHNYLQIKNNEINIILNYYKTSKTYGQQKIAIKDKLYDELLEYIHNTSVKYLLINEKTGYPMSSHDITMRLRRITNKLFGVKFGSNAIRHMYVSHKYAHVTEMMKEDSKMMLHSKSIQDNYIKF